MLVRRMDPLACTPCKTPEFPGFTHLGEFVNVGKVKPHYYYISKHKATPAVAVKTAANVINDVFMIMLLCFIYLLLNCKNRAKFEAVLNPYEETVQPFS